MVILSAGAVMVMYRPVAVGDAKQQPAAGIGAAALRCVASSARAGMLTLRVRHDGCRHDGCCVGGLDAADVQEEYARIKAQVRAAAAAVCRSLFVRGCHARQLARARSYPLVSSPPSLPLASKPVPCKCSTAAPPHLCEPHCEYYCKSAVNLTVNPTVNYHALQVAEKTSKLASERDTAATQLKSDEDELRSAQVRTPV